MRNWFLLVIFVGLLGFIYYQEEWKGAKTKESEGTDWILGQKSLQELRGIKLVRAELLRAKDTFYTAQYHRTVDPVTVKSLWEILRGIKIARVLSVEERNAASKDAFFPNEKDKIVLFFDGEELTLSLGAKLEFDQSFYMEINNGDIPKWVIAYDSQIDTGIYDERTYHRSERKYQRLQGLWYLEEDFFYDRHLFKRLDAKWTRVAFVGGEKFEINLLDNTTEPVAFGGIDYSTVFFGEFMERLTNLQGQQIYHPYDEKLLQEKKAEFILYDSHGRKYQISLFERYGSLLGYFVTIAGNDNLYELTAEDANLFGYSVQDFWDLKIPVENLLTRQNDEAFDVLFKGHGMFRLTAERGDKLQVLVVSSPQEQLTANHAAFRKLFSFLVSRADRVSLYSGQISLEATNIQLNYGGKSFHIIERDKELLVINAKEKFALHYFVGGQLPIPLEFKDYFYQRIL